MCLWWEAFVAVVFLLCVSRHHLWMLSGVFVLCPCADDVMTTSLAHIFSHNGVSCRHSNSLSSAEKNMLPPASQVIWHRNVSNDTSCKVFSWEMTSCCVISDCYNLGNHVLVNGTDNFLYHYFPGHAVQTLIDREDVKREGSEAK